MDAYMTSLLEVRFGACVESWVEQKLYLTLNTSPKIVCLKEWILDFDEYKPRFDGFLMLKSWDVASMHVGPCRHVWDLESHVNWHKWSHGEVEGEPIDFGEAKPSIPSLITFKLNTLCLHTPSLPKCLSSFLILARSRPAHHCPSSCKYIWRSKNRKQQVLRNTQEVAVSKAFLMMTLIPKNIWLWASNIQPGVESHRSNETDHLMNHKETWQSFSDKIIQGVGQSFWDKQFHE